jgi:hypothetical protein
MLKVFITAGVLHPILVAAIAWSPTLSLTTQLSSNVLILRSKMTLKLPPTMNGMLLAASSRMVTISALTTPLRSYSLVLSSETALALQSYASMANRLNSTVSALHSMLVLARTRTPTFPPLGS